MSEYIPTLTEEENKEFLKMRLKRMQADLEKYGGMAAQQSYSIDRPLPPGAKGDTFGITFKNGREARAEIRQV